MLYAYIFQLRDWAQWHIFSISAWLNKHPDRDHPGREQSTKDLRAFFSFINLHLITE